MKRSLIYFTCSLLASLLCMVQPRAQQSSIDYDLNNYRLPYLRRHVLELNFATLGNLSSASQERNDNLQYKVDEQNYSCIVSPFYSFYLNSAKYQLTQNIRAQLPNLTFSYDKNINDNLKILHVHPSLNYDGEFREYMKGKFFLEQDVVFGLDFYNHNSFTEFKNDSSVVYRKNKQENVSNNYIISVPILLGWGRLERIEDARLAIYILDDLKQAGLLARNVSDVDIEELALRISEIKNERFFDSRLKKIWELEQIDSVLASMGLFEEEKINYFALLNDNMDYSNGPVRQSGFRISAGTSPDLNYSKYRIDEEDNFYNIDSISRIQSDQKNRDIGINIICRIDYHKPLNLFWQLLVTNELTISKSFSKMVDTQYNSGTDENSESQAIYDRAQARIGYYPNSRTSLYFFIDEQFIFRKTIPDESVNTKHTQLSSYAGISMDYYISSRIRLNLNSSLNYSINSYKSVNKYDNTNLRYYFSASLIYKLL